MTTLSRSKRSSYSSDAIWDAITLDLYRPIHGRALTAAANGRAEDAVKLCGILDAIAEYHGCIADHAARLGQVAVLQNAWATGEALLRSAQARGLTEGEPLVLLARALTHQGRVDDALEVLRGVIKREPENADAWRDLGVGLLALEAHEPAQEALSRALELKPGDQIAATALRTISSPAVRFIPEEGESGPEEEKAVDRAMRLFQQRRYAEAKVAYAQAITEDPDDHYVYLGLGDCHYMLGDFHLAAAYFEESIAVEPTTSAWRFLGDAYRKGGRRPQARAAYESALALNPEYHIARQQLDGMLKEDEM